MRALDIHRTVLGRLHALLDAYAPCRPATGDADRVLAETHTFYVALDEEGVVLAWNRAAAELFGYPPEQALGRPCHDLIIPPAHQAAHRAGVEHYLRTGHGRGIGSSVEVEALRADGSLVPVQLTIWAQQDASRTVFHALGHDLSRQRQRDHALHVLARHRKALLRSDSTTAVRATLCGTLREATDSHGVYLYEPEEPSGSTFRLTAQSTTFGARGRSRVTLDDRLAGYLATDQDRELHAGSEQLDGSEAAEALRATGLTTFVVRPLRREEHLVGILLLGWLGGRTPPRDVHLLDLLASEALDVFDRLDVQERLRLLARTDPLTDTWNRREYAVRLQDAVAQAERDGSALTLVALDLDHFKSYNDAHGHPAGDALLVEAVRRWQEVVPGEGLARTGGDEFAVLLPGWTAEAAQEVVTALRAATPPPVGLTAGVVQHEPGLSAEQLLQRADAALYLGKRTRGGADGGA